MPIWDTFVIGQSVDMAVDKAITYYDDQLNALGETLVDQVGENLGKPVRAIPLNMFKKKEIPINRIPDKNATILIRKNKKNIVERQKFVLTNVGRGGQELYQIFQTFGEYIVDFYGESPRIYTFTGTLVERAGSGGNWAKEMEEFYNYHIRGGVLARDGYVAEIHYGSVTVIGYPITFRITEDAQSGDISGFSMTVLVRDTVYDPDVIIPQKTKTTAKAQG